MKKSIKLFTIMIALAMQSLTMWATTTSLFPVSLHYRQGPLLGNNPKPTKAPAKFSIPLSIAFDDESQQLQVVAFADIEFTYTIFSESGEAVSQGLLQCYDNYCYSIDLNPLNNGEYNIVITYNGHNFEGCFEIYNQLE